MEPFFLFLELMIPIAAGILLLKKGSLAIVYMPLLFFARTLFDETKYIPGPFYHYFFYLLLFYFMFYNLPFFRRNLFSNLLVFYFLVLAMDVEEFKSIRTYYLHSIWLFISVPLVQEIYKNYTKERILKEVNIAAFAMMMLFVINVLLSTYYEYNPFAIYGISSGLLYGRMSSDIYNIFPFAIYILFRKSIKDNNIFYLVLYFVSMFFILLTLRRSVMALSLLGSLLVLIEFVKPEEFKKFSLYGVVLVIVSLVVINTTSFVDQFVERYEQRGLDDRPIEEENRLMEFTLIYKDLFVYYDYDPWTGYGLFDTAGNYGKKIFRDRSLHTDFAVLIHISGIIGLLLYLLMFGKSFLSIWNRLRSRTDLLLFLFMILCFLIFFVNGRFTTISSMLLMLTIINLPLAKQESLI